LGVAGREEKGHPPRSSSFPLEVFPRSYGDKLWDGVASKLGIQLDHASHARNSSPYSGRPECAAFGVCSICPIGARYSADFHIEEAEQTGLVDILTETVARRIDMASSGKVRAIHASTIDGSDLEVEAGEYVIAAHAIETARLLLLSNVGNHSDLVGRNLMEHWYAGVGGTAPEPSFPGQTGFITQECSHWYEGDDRQERGAIKLEFGDFRDTLSAGIAEGLAGVELDAFDRDNFGRWTTIIAEVEHQPNPDSRISLDETEVDKFGDPVPHISFALSEIDLHTHAKALDAISLLLNARGCTDIDVTHRFARAHHHMGTCRMSAEPDEGVVDEHGKVHGSQNLHIAGSSVFPTSGARQPTLTVAALALRLADRLTTKP
ncbi:MAG: GMC oxidoreductase, partial [Gammaproteobacteria bacterium]